MQQDKIYQLTLQNEVNGLGWQTKTISEIYWEGEETQKQWALRYVKTLREFVKIKETFGMKCLIFHLHRTLCISPR